MGLLTTEAREAMKSGRIQAANLCELDFSFGTERYWTGLTPLEHEGRTWSGVGNLGTISRLEASQDLRANGLQLAIKVPFERGNPVPRFKNLRASEYKNRQARVIVAFFNEGFARVIHVLERRYFMDVLDYEINPTESALLTLKIESELMAGGRRSVRRWTDVQQRDTYPGDLSFQALNYISSGVEVRWGTEGALFV